MFKRIIGLISAAIDKLSDYMGYIAGGLIVVMVFLTCYEVLLRYVFHRAPMVADEFGAYMLVWVTFLGLAYTMKKKSHIRVMVLISRFPARITRWLRPFTLAVGLAYAIFLMRFSIDLVVRSYTKDFRATTWIETPTYIPQLIIPIGLGLFAIYLFIEMIRSFRDAIRLAYAPPEPAETRH